MCSLLRTLYGHPNAGALWDKGVKRILSAAGFRTINGWEGLYVNEPQGLFLAVYVADFQMAGRTGSMKPMWEKLQPRMTLDPPVPFNGNTYLGCAQHDVSVDEEKVQRQSTAMFDPFSTPQPKLEEEEVTPPKPEARRRRRPRQLGRWSRSPRQLGNQW